MTRTVFVSLFAAAALVGGTVQAHAQPAAAGRVYDGYSHDPGINVHTTRLDYADLDLSTEAGRNTLYARIDIAADRVCRPHPAEDSDQAEREDYATCRVTTIAQTLTLVRGPERAAMLALAKSRAHDLAVLP